MSFDGDGYAQVDFNGMRDAAQSLAVLPDGKIIAAGLATVTSSDNGNAIGIARFNSSGQLDQSFGTAGKVSALPANAFIDQINDRYPMIVQPDGKIVVMGAFVTRPIKTNNRLSRNIVTCLF